MTYPQHIPELTTGSIWEARGGSNVVHATWTKPGGSSFVAIMGLSAGGGGGGGKAGANLTAAGGGGGGGPGIWFTLFFAADFVPDNLAIMLGQPGLGGASAANGAAGGATTINALGGVGRQTLISIAGGNFGALGTAAGGAAGVLLGAPAATPWTSAGIFTTNVGVVGSPGTLGTAAVAVVAGQPQGGGGGGGSDTTTTAGKGADCTASLGYPNVAGGAVAGGNGNDGPTILRQLLLILAGSGGGGRANGAAAAGGRGGNGAPGCGGGGGGGCGGTTSSGLGGAGGNGGPGFIRIATW